MATASEAAGAIGKIARRQMEEGVAYGTVGIPDGDNWLVNVPNRTGYIYVLLESGTLVEANDSNSLVSHDGGTGVKLRWVNGEYVVQGPDTRGGGGSGTPAPGAGVGSHDHDVGSGREYFHPGELFKPLGGAPLDNVSLLVKVFAGFYVYEGVYTALPLSTVDLSASVPATSGGLNQYRYAVVCINGATGALAVVNTTPRLTPALLDADITAASIATSYLPLFAVRLVSGQTAINDIATFRDVKAGYSTVTGGGGTARNAPVTVTSDYEVELEDEYIFVDATGGDVEVTLPPAADTGSRRYTIKQIDADLNTVTVVGDSAETIDGDASIELSSDYLALSVVSDGTQWFIV